MHQPGPRDSLAGLMFFCEKEGGAGGRDATASRRMPLIIRGVGGLEVAEDGPLLVVLADTGERRDDLPVLVLHNSPQPALRVLTRGLSGHLLRVYRWGRTYLERHDSTRPEPAYLLLSDNEGGFARNGFYLDDEAKRESGYVDLHRDMAVSGSFGALDQIFPHELAHLLVAQFSGPRRPGGSTQVHGVGVRTDPETAFDEGFAEHFQVMAVDDPDAEPDTAILANDVDQHRRAEEQVSQYARELLDDPASALGFQARFPWWFGRAENVLRYCAVKRNGFALEPREVSQLIHQGAYWKAYLASNVVPGQQGDQPKSSRIMVQSEGVIASLFCRWATDNRILTAYREDGFYRMFGADRERVEPVENAYLKILHALRVSRAQDIYSLLQAYGDEYPDEKAVVNSIVADVTSGQGFETAPQIWMANSEFLVGTSVFDQFRVVPRAHTFDLNAASMLDLLTVPGVSRQAAATILEGSPYSSIQDLLRLACLDPGLRERFAGMVTSVRREAESTELELLRSFEAILRSYLSPGSGG